MPDHKDQNQPPQPPAPLSDDALILRYLDGLLGPQELAELNGRLRADAGLRARLIGLTLHTHHLQALIAKPDLALVRDELTNKPDDSGAAEALAELAKLHEEGLGQPISLEAHRKQQQQHTEAHRKVQRKARLILGGSIAALIAVAALAGLVLSALTQQPEQLVEQPADETRVVATLTNQRDAKWQTAEGDAIQLAPDDTLLAGTTLELTEGFAEITTNRGAIAIIEAPATIELIDNDNALRLHTGKLLGICETESSKGFLVRTLHTDITDLGTRFGVSLDADGAVFAEVFDGEVEFQETRDDGDVAAIVLSGGDAYAIDSKGNALARESFATDTFSGLFRISASMHGEPAEAPAELTGQVKLVTAEQVEIDLGRILLPDDDQALLYMEQHSIKPTGAFSLTFDRPGTYVTFDDLDRQAFTAVPAGSPIRSYVLSYSLGDRRQPIDAQGQAVPHSATGQVRFEEEILGVIATRQHWDGFLKVCGHASGLVWDTTHRLPETSNGSDMIKISNDRRTLKFQFVVGSGADTVRVILRAPGSGGTD